MWKRIAWESVENNNTWEKCEKNAKNSMAKVWKISGKTLKKHL